MIIVGPVLPSLLPPPLLFLYLYILHYTQLVSLYRWPLLSWSPDTPPRFIYDVLYTILYMYAYNMLYRYDIIIEVGAYNAAATALTRQSGAICCPLLIIYIIYLVFIFIRIYMGNRERILKREPTAVAPPSSTSLMNNGQVTYETNEHEKGEKKYKGREKKKSFSVPLFSTSLASNDLFLLFWFFKMSFYLFTRLFIAVKSIERLWCDPVWTWTSFSSFLSHVVIDYTQQQLHPQKEGKIEKRNKMLVSYKE